MVELVADDDKLKTVGEYAKIVRRRFARFAVPVLVLFPLCIIVIFAIEPRYRSEASILIEDQKVPREFVVSTITSFAAQRIQVISRRVLTAENIRKIADKHDLYRDDATGQRMPITLMAERFRADTHLELVSADVIDPVSGRATQATIAFTLAYDHVNPSTSQNVTNELVTLFLDENLRTRTERASSTEEFLGAESDSLNRELLRQEQALSEFKAANEGALPELYQFNLSTLERLSREMSDVDLRLKELAKRRIELSAELAQINPSAPVVLPTGEAVLSDHDRLRALRSEYRRKAALYEATHPEIRQLAREIEELESVYGSSANHEELAEALKAARSRYAELQQRFDDRHGEVIAAKRVVDQLVVELADAETDELALTPDNPAYVLLDTQRKSLAFEEAALADKRTILADRLAKIEGLISRAPSVERDYQALLRDYRNTELKYQEVRAKQREAKVAENLESERKGERFVLIEPPSLPLEPASPNRPILTLVGLLLSLGVGIGAAALAESTDHAIYGDAALTRVAGRPPYAVVGYIANSEDAALASQTQRRWLMSLAAGAAVMLVFAHVFIKPLDLVWFMLLHQIGM